MLVGRHIKYNFKLTSNWDMKEDNQIPKFWGVVVHINFILF